MNKELNKEAVMEFHEAANIFPMDEDNLTGLAADIGKNGQQVPIEILNGSIIDGRRRFKACEMAGVQPKFRDVQVADPVAYVLSLNLHRRHLTTGERCLVAGRATKYIEKLAAEAKERRKRKPSGSAKENLPEQKGQTRDKIGELVGVSGKSIDYAKRVLSHGTPKLIDAVDDGSMAVSTASRIACLPASDQDEAIDNFKGRPGGRKDEDIKPLEEGQADGPEIDNRRTKRLSFGVIHAHEAINCLSRIPKDDKSRTNGLEMVSKWISENS